MLVPSEAVRPAGLAGAGAVYVITIVLPLADTPNVPAAAHLVPMVMLAALAELPLMIVHEYELFALNPPGALAGKLMVRAEDAPTAPEAAILSQSVLPSPVTSQV
ncbi:MAG: hypothetical protein BWX54_01865 [Verrucomicrobia bacterium ADurb.Bin018]|nr:MAG: hypothetical protein BWX54_01865 [Verrucomicrobia bacterium ADurb.Bin018]